MYARTTTTIVLLAGLNFGFSETVQLRDKTSITGKILAEKKDQLVVDLGFTVLVVPRNQVAKITRDEAAPTRVNAPPNSAASKLPPPVTAPIASLPPVSPGELPNDLFQTSKTPLAEKAVRDLVNQLGEGVVQVRTPGGLGSGFILNEDGYLITNFHVIEGETQISVEVYHQRDGQLERKSYKEVRIIAMNKFADLTLLKIEGKDLPRFKHVNLGSADAL